MTTPRWTTADLENMVNRPNTKWNARLAGTLLALQSNIEEAMQRHHTRITALEAGSLAHSAEHRELAGRWPYPLDVGAARVNAAAHDPAHGSDACVCHWHQPDDTGAASWHVHAGEACPVHPRYHWVDTSPRCHDCNDYETLECPRCRVDYCPAHRDGHEQECWR